MNKAMVFCAVALTAVLALLYPYGAGAQGQMACGSRDAIIKALKDHYKEKQHAIALAATAGVVELFTSEKGATWTLIVTSHVGQTCIAAAGKNWRDLPQAPDVGT
jgi:hypothetical protein